MTLAGKAYYDGVAKIGEIATGSPVSTELGELTSLVVFYKNLAYCPRSLIVRWLRSRTQKRTGWAL